MINKLNCGGCAKPNLKANTAPKAVKSKISLKGNLNCGACSAPKNHGKNLNKVG